MKKERKKSKENTNWTKIYTCTILFRQQRRNNDSPIRDRVTPGRIDKPFFFMLVAVAGTRHNNGVRATAVLPRQRWKRDLENARTLNR